MDRFSRPSNRSVRSLRPFSCYGQVATVVRGPRYEHYGTTPLVASKKLQGQGRSCRRYYQLESFDEPLLHDRYTAGSDQELRQNRRDEENYALRGAVSARYGGNCYFRLDQSRTLEKQST